MPHDKNGKVLKNGDVVLVLAKVATISAGEEYCNVTLQFGYDKPHGPDNIQSSVTLNAKQVELVESEETSEDTVDAETGSPEASEAGADEGDAESEDETV